MDATDERPERAKNIMDEPLDKDSIPPIPHELINAAQRGELVVFVGAGVSRVAGAPSWKELATEYSRYLYTKGIIKCGEMEDLILSHSLNPRKLISICHNLLMHNQKEKGRGLEEFFLEKALKFKLDTKDKNKEQIYQNLYAWNLIYVTTNFDNGFYDVVDGPQEKQAEMTKLKSGDISNIGKRDQIIFDNPRDLLESNLKQGRIFYLHGSLKKPDYLVLTLQHYMNRYWDSLQNKAFPFTSKFLEDIFRRFTILFLGYGLESEYEVLENLCKVASSHATARHHFLLKGFRSNERFLIENEKEYLAHMKIRLIDYLHDEHRFDQLGHIIQSWVSKFSVAASERSVYHASQSIDDALRKRDIKNENIFNLLRAR